jgi:hypothetical protein
MLLGVVFHRSPLARAPRNTRRLFSRAGCEASDFSRCSRKQRPSELPRWPSEPTQLPARIRTRFLHVSGSYRPRNPTPSQDAWLLFFEDFHLKGGLRSQLARYHFGFWGAGSSPPATPRDPGARPPSYPPRSWAVRGAASPQRRKGGLWGRQPYGKLKTTVSRPICSRRTTGERPKQIVVTCMDGLRQCGQPTGLERRLGH